MTKSEALAAMSLALLSVAVAGCSARHVEYRSPAEIPDGPGMFSGKEDEFILYSDKRKQVRAEEAAANPARGEIAPEDYREFREFQDFKRWRELNRDTPEYREFQEWREWRAYRDWKQRTQ